MEIIALLEIIALIPTTILLVIILSQYIILLKPRKEFTDFFPPISILVPAHNEGKYIRKTIESLLNAEYPNKKEIIVIDDGSTDETPLILTELHKKGVIRKFRTNHIGKSNALNFGLKKTTNDIVCIVDGDSNIDKNALKNIARPFSDKKIAAVAGSIKVKNKNESVIAWFQKIEYLYFSLFRGICSRINGSIFTPGPLSAYRKSLLLKLNGFNSDLFMEDVDISLKIIKSGYRIHTAEDAITNTNVPTSLREWARQRKRWTKGGIEIVKSNMNFFFRRSFKGAGSYSFPVLTYWYFHSVIMALIIFYQVFYGYYNYFFIYGDVMSFNVIQYFLYWFSLLGILNLVYQILIGAIAPSLLLVLSIVVTAITYPLYFLSFRRFKEKLDIRDFFAFLFFFPYWVMVMLIQTYSNINWFRSSVGRNWWRK